MSRKVVSFVKLYDRFHRRRSIDKFMFQQRRSENIKKIHKNIKENQQIFFNTLINLRKKD